MRKFLILALGLATSVVAGSLLLYFNPLCAEEIPRERFKPIARKRGKVPNRSRSLQTI
jgi:hypothetical protein